jgi:purine-binding chemotaxis protein CheW
VIDLEPDQIQPAPRIGTQIRTDFIKGMGKRDTQFIMILDIDRVFSAEELAVVRGQEAGKQEHGKKEAGQRPVEKQTAVEQLVGAAA